MDELKGDENCHAGNGFHEIERQLRLQGIGRPDKHFGKNAHPSFTYVFGYFFSFSQASKIKIHILLRIQSSLLVFLTGRRIAF